MRRLLSALTITFYFGRAVAQETDSAAVETPTENYFRFQYENDFFTATDRYYTQGTMMSFIHPALRHSPFFYTLPSLRNSKKYYGLTLRQDVFTPISIRYMGGAIFHGERPFTATLYFSHRLHSLRTEKKTILEAALEIGIMGPAAKGKETQEGIHTALDNIQPQGWDNQLSQDAMLNYELLFEKGLFASKYFEMVAGSKARAGTIYTDLDAGLKLRFGIMEPYFRNLGMQKKNGLRIFVITAASVRAVGYNATLQGGVFNHRNIYTLNESSVERIVAQASATLLLSYRRLGLEYGYAYVTKEFENGLDHGWGRVGIWFCF